MERKNEVEVDIASYVDATKKLIDRVEKIRNIATDINSTHPRRIWVEGDGSVYRDGPGNAQRVKMSELDMIKLIHIAQAASERILSVQLMSNIWLTVPSRFEDEYPDAAAFLMRVYKAGGYFRQPRNGQVIMLPKLPPVSGLKRNTRCPCGSGNKTKRCHPAWI